MYWFDLKDLLHYHPNTGGYCYCELLIEPSDLMLQARIPEVSPDTEVYIEAYAPDGVTLLGGITSNFKGIIATDSNGDYYANLQMQTFNSILCEECFVLKVQVVDNFISCIFNVSS